jgi:methyl-coenzyme M reductase gamma subunit
MRFDMLQRCLLGDDGIVRYVKNQIGEPLDRAVAVGKPMDEAWMKKHSTIFHTLVGESYRADTEYIEYIQRIHSLRTKYGFMPKE